MKQRSAMQDIVKIWMIPASVLAVSSGCLDWTLSERELDTVDTGTASDTDTDTDTDSDTDTDIDTDTDTDSDIDTDSDTDTDTGTDSDTDVDSDTDTDADTDTHSEVDTNLICYNTPNTREGCETAMILGRTLLPVNSVATNQGFANDIDFECNGDDYDGPDIFLRVFAFSGETVEMRILVGSKDFSIFVFYNAYEDASNPTCDETTLVTCADDGGAGVDESLSVTAVQDGWYYFAIDSHTGGIAGRGDFTVELDITNPLKGKCYGSFS